MDDLMPVKDGDVTWKGKLFAIVWMVAAFASLFGGWFGRAEQRETNRDLKAQNDRIEAQNREIRALLEQRR